MKQNKIKTKFYQNDFIRHKITRKELICRKTKQNNQPNDS